LICPSCIYMTRRQSDMRTLGCGHNPPCPVSYVSTSADILEESPLSFLLDDLLPAGYIPTKVNALATDIMALSQNIKWFVDPASSRNPADLCLLNYSVAFSTWRITLDVVEAELNRVGISCLRFDGKVPQKDRQDVLDRFRSDPSVRVLLLTLACGSAGCVNERNQT
jgi:SNF2 family DNA or RNA helicase